MRIATNTVGSVYELYHSELTPLFGAAEARAMARTVFRSVFGWDMIELDMQRSMALSESEILKVYTPLTRLRAGEPLQYILERCWFMGMELRVGPGVLIPRPETEELVDLILQSGRSYQRILDVGTGSGCIGLAFKKHVPHAEVMAMDVSVDALAIARGNGASLALDVQWFQGDILNDGVTMPSSLDLVVSNPPYIPITERDTLDPHVREHEPSLALFVDDTDPLLFYRSIARHAMAALEKGGELWFEAHHRFAGAAGELVAELGFKEVKVLNDMSGSPRFIRAER